mgnify:CR=1 FL=1
MNKRKAQYDPEQVVDKKTSDNLWSPLRKMKHKKRTISGLPINNFVSGTGIKNYLLRDPVLDWFELYYFTNNSNCVMTRNKKKMMETNISDEKSNLSVLFENGDEFEQKVINKLEHLFEGKIITINTEGKKGMNRKNYKETIDAMKLGIPIIVQGVLYNDDNDTGGIADLIVRSDYLNQVFRRSVLNSTMETFKAPKLCGNYHYRVIDIKWTTMTLCANGYTIRNDNRFPSYKGQVAIYNCAVGKIQGYTPTEAYILAKAWKIDRKKDPMEGYSCFDLLGVVDFSGFDNSYIDKTVDAINWVRDVRSEGMSWDLLNPTREEMYPNACNNNDAPWTKQKKQLCQDLNEITQIWYVTDQHRKTAHSKGIMSWKDPLCNSITMEIGGETRADIIDEILSINRSSKNIIRPSCIKNNLLNWQQRSAVDFYVDFETMNGCFYSQEMNIENSKTDADYIFMIGVGYVENNEWQYVSFTVDDITYIEERRILDEFTNFITTKSQHHNEIPRLFHWSQAEVMNMRHVNDRHDHRWVEWESSIRWVDMYNVFINEPIVIKGALNFKLKEIGKAMHKLNLIPTVWSDSGPSDGFQAMLSASDYYKNKSNDEMTSKSTNTYNEIINYNEVDCKIIWEIVEYLRTNHCHQIYDN